MKAKWLMLIAVEMLLCGVVTCGAAVPDSWFAMPMRELMAKGFHYLKAERADSALYVFTVVGNRYRTDLPESERRMAVHALNNVGAICFGDGDYSTSYKYLSVAMSRCEAERFDDIMPDIDLNMANLYDLLEDHSERAAECYRKCFHAAAKLRKYDLMIVAFLNICSTCTDVDIKEFGQILTADISPDSVPNVDYARHLYRGLVCGGRGNYSGARKEYAMMPECINDEYTRLRGECLVHKIIARSFIAENKHDSAVVSYNHMRMVACKAAMTAEEVEACREMSVCYKEMGNSAESGRLHMSYLEKKDSMISANNLIGINNMLHKDEIGRVEQKLDNMVRERQWQQWLMWSVSVVALVVLVFGMVLALKNRRLQRQNRVIYMKNIEMRMAEEREKKRMKKQEEQLLDTASGVVSKEKYRNSNLSESEKDDIYDKVEMVMADVGMICRMDFNIEMLAQAIGSKTKYVSQVINERYQTSFSVLLSNCRAKEASRRMGNIEEYGHLTIEAVGQSVGFRARASFINAFKRVTGLTPSEYIKEARKMQGHTFSFEEDSE